MDYNGTYEPSCNFFAISRILLDAHGQTGGKILLGHAYQRMEK
jgi:hypothetical protein